MALLCYLSLVAGLVVVAPEPEPARAQPAAGGPVVLLGIDGEDGGPGGHGPIGNYIQLVGSIIGSVSNGNSGGILVLGGGKSATDHVTRFWNAVADGVDREVTYVNGAANIAAQSFAGFEMIAVVGSVTETRSGGLTSSENNAISARDTQIANFVNLGGGLLGFDQVGFSVPFDYVGALGEFEISNLTYSSIQPTPEGQAVGITTALNVCCWHQVFDVYPDFLDVLATAGTTGRVAGLGGQVQVPPPGIDAGQTFGACNGWQPAVSHALTGNGWCSDDPVNTATGAFEDAVLDLVMPGIGLDFELLRTYSSANQTDGPLGKGWSHPYAARLEMDANGDVTFHADTGQQILYELQADGSFNRRTGVRSILVTDAGEYELTRADQVVYRFDGSGRLESVTDPNGNQLSLGYDGDGHLVSLTDTVGRAVTFGSDADGRLTSATLPDNRSVTYGYIDGLLTSVTDPTGATTSYGYEPEGRLTTITDPTDVTVVANSYGPDGRVASQLDALDNEIAFAWNEETQTSTMTDPVGAEWVAVYSNHLLIETIDPLGNVVRYDYDGDANLTVVTNARGNTTTMTYDERGNLLTVMAPAPLSHQESFVYDDDNNLVAATDGRDNTTTFEYDSAGNLTSITEPGSITTTFTQDPNGTGLVSAVTDPRSKTTSFDYDSDGNLTQVTSPAGEITTFGYDGSGRPTSLVDPRGKVVGANPTDFTTTLDYDAADRLTSVTDPLGHTTSWAYDAVGNLTSRTDANDNTVSYAHDAARRLTAVTAPDGAGTSYEYDVVNNLVARIDAKTHTTSYGYDAANRLTSVTDPLGRVWSYAYDASGNLIEVVDAVANATSDPGDGTTIFAYDVANRLTSIDYSDATANVSFAYDANGNRTSMSDGGGTVVYSYDSRNLLTEVTRGTDTFFYQYDAVGNVTQRTYPDATMVDYAYDGVGRLASVTQDAVTTSYDYDAAGNLTSTTLPNGTAESRTYDPAGRLTALAWSSSSTTLSDLTYTLDAVGNPTALTGTTNVTYAYDVRDQLVEACFDPACDDFVRYSYDPIGNRLTEQRPEGTTSYSYNAADQLTATDGPDGTVAYEYDANGNQIAQGDRIFAYDGANRVVEVHQPGDGVDIIAVAAGHGHSLALAADGRIWAWGSNALGQLGDGTNNSTTTPIDVSGLSDVTAIAAGDGHSVALEDDGTVWAWGEYTNGYDPDAVPLSTVPVEVDGLTDVVAITADSGYAMALRSDGTVWAWGLNVFGEAGWPTGYISTPQQVDGVSGVVAFDAGGGLQAEGDFPGIHSIAATGAGTIEAWGSDEYGQLGDGSLSDAVLVAAGGRHSLAVTSSGTVWAWGDNLYGQLGAGVGGSTPQQVGFDPEDVVVGIEAGDLHSVALLDDGSVASWGYNGSGQLGRDTPTNSGELDQVPGLADVTAVAAGNLHSLAVTSTGTVWSWGNNEYGQLGDGTTTNRTTPVESSGLPAIGGGGSAFTIGYGYDGDGTRINTTTPQGATDWLWDVNAPLPLLALERDEGDTILRRYTYGVDLLSMATGDGEFYYHHDRLGSVTNLTDDAGAELWTYDYEPFGTFRSETQQSPSAPDNPMRFAGERFDTDAGLYHLRVRDYDPTVGRFTTTDPLPAPIRDPYVSAYHYVSNRPTVLVDPSGLSAALTALEQGARNWMTGRSSIQRDPFEVMFGVSRTEAGLPPRKPIQVLTASGGACAIGCIGLGRLPSGELYWYTGVAVGGSIGVNIGLATPGEITCQQTGWSLAATVGAYQNFANPEAQSGPVGPSSESGVVVGAGATVFHHMWIHGVECAR